jgi:hypothetical protein
MSFINRLVLLCLCAFVVMLGALIIRWRQIDSERTKPESYVCGSEFNDDVLNGRVRSEECDEQF